MSQAISRSVRSSQGLNGSMDAPVALLPAWMRLARRSWPWAIRRRSLNNQASRGSSLLPRSDSAWFCSSPKMPSTRLSPNTRLRLSMVSWLRSPLGTAGAGPKSCAVPTGRFAASTTNGPESALSDAPASEDAASPEVAELQAAAASETAAIVRRSWRHFFQREAVGVGVVEDDEEVSTHL